MGETLILPISFDPFYSRCPHLSGPTVISPNSYPLEQSFAVVHGYIRDYGRDRAIARRWRFLWAIDRLLVMNRHVRQSDQYWETFKQPFSLYPVHSFPYYTIFLTLLTDYLAGQSEKCNLEGYPRLNTIIAKDVNP
jgi:hypothetical protein